MGKVIDFATAQKEKTTEKTEFPVDPAIYGYFVGRDLLPILKRLNLYNLEKVLNYANALLKEQLKTNTHTAQKGEKAPCTH